MYFGVAHSIRRLFGSAEFCATRAKDRGGSPWWNSPEARRLGEAIGGGLFEDSSTSPYALGFDFAQMFAFRVHSTGIIMLRCEDMDHETRSKRKFHIPLMVICGPREPSNISAYLAPILEEFQEYGPNGK